MSDEKRKKPTDSLVAQFKRAALVAYFGFEDEHLPMQDAGIASARRTVEALDALGPDGRISLAPLLDDPDERVRGFAARRLLDVLPERAVATLRELSCSPHFHVRIDAGRALILHELGERHVHP